MAERHDYQHDRLSHDGAPESTVPDSTSHAPGTQARSPDTVEALVGSSDVPLAAVGLPSGRVLAVNPTLASAYAAAGATFVDVTRATGGYIPLTESRPSGSRGSTPVAVADVCALTYFCRQQDVHPTNSGYALIARLIVATLPAHSVRRAADR